jgi:hypothetical protein
MITKKVNIELAGQMASQVNCKCILIDTENNHNLIVDAVANGKVYYQDIALNLNDLPFELNEDELNGLSQ